MSGVLETSKKEVTALYTLNWIVKDFDTTCPEDGQNTNVWIKSPTFTTGQDLGLKSQWSIHMIRKVDTLNFFLEPVQLKEEHKPKIILSIGTVNNPRIFSKDLSNVQCQGAYHPGKPGQTKGWLFHPFTKISLLRGHNENLLEGNTLRVCLDIELNECWTPDVIIENDVATKVKLDSLTSNRFLADFQKLNNCEKFYDVKIRCGDQVFLGHRLILSVRSTVFEAMFNSDMTETTTGEIVIEDLEPNIMKTILHYIYTGRTNDLPGSCSWTDLIHGAEKYDLQELKKYCFQNLIVNMNQKNVANLAVAAYKYDADKEVQVAVKDYCHRHIQNLLEDASFREVFFKMPKAFYD